MNLSKKTYIMGIVSAVALCVVVLALPAGAQERSQTFVVKEKAVVSDTVVGSTVPGTAEGVAPREAPFEGGRERLPAGTAMFGKVSYASAVVSRTPRELVLNTTISKMEDDATLSALAAKVYRDNDGQNYDKVTIFWHVGERLQPSTPWARTDIAKGNTIYKIARIQQ